MFSAINMSLFDFRTCICLIVSLITAYFVCGSSGKMVGQRLK